MGPCSGVHGAAACRLGKPLSLPAGRSQVHWVQEKTGRAVGKMSRWPRPSRLPLHGVAAFGINACQSCEQVMRASHPSLSMVGPPIQQTSSRDDRSQVQGRTVNPAHQRSSGSARPGGRASPLWLLPRTALAPPAMRAVHTATCPTCSRCLMVMRSLASLMASSAASLSSREISPVSPPLAASKNSTTARCVRFDVLRRGRTCSKALSSLLNSALFRHRGISNGMKRLRICASVCSASSASEVPTTTTLNCRSSARSSADSMMPAARSDRRPASGALRRRSASAAQSAATGRGPIAPAWSGWPWRCAARPVRTAVRRRSDADRGWPAYAWQQSAAAQPL